MCSRVAQNKNLNLIAKNKNNKTTQKEAVVHLLPLSLQVKGWVHLRALQVYLQASKQTKMQVVGKM